MEKVTAIGGMFFKCKDSEIAKECYYKHLGVDAGALWRQL